MNLLQLPNSIYYGDIMSKKKKTLKKLQKAGGLFLRNMEHKSKAHKKPLLISLIVLFCFALLVFLSSFFGNLLFSVLFLFVMYAFYRLAKIGWKAGEKIEQNYFSWRGK